MAEATLSITHSTCNHPAAPVSALGTAEAHEPTRAESAARAYQGLMAAKAIIEAAANAVEGVDETEPHTWALREASRLLEPAMYLVCEQYFAS